jgi:hypothetical protein
MDVVRVVSSSARRGAGASSSDSGSLSRKGVGSLSRMNGGAISRRGGGKGAISSPVRSGAWVGSCVVISVPGVFACG